MKVILCLHHFLPAVVGGTEVYNLRLAQQLKKVGITPIILIPNFGKAFNNEYVFEGIRVIEYEEDSNEDRKMIMGKSKPDGLVAFSGILKNEKPDIVHFQELAPGRGISIFHVQKTYELNIPIVLTFHLSYYTCFKGSLVFKDVDKCDGVIDIAKCTACIYHSKGILGIRASIINNVAMLLYKGGVNTTAIYNSFGTALGVPFIVDKIRNDLNQLALYANKIITVASWYKKILEGNGIASEKIIYIKQGLTNDCGKRQEFRKMSLPLKIVFLGRINELKGIHLLITAINQLPEDAVSLTIFGQETPDTYTADCKRQSGAKKNIYWKGKLEQDQVQNEIANFDLLCLPSTFSEMSPLVIQEAFAAGLPVLASDVYGNAEQVQDGINGWLFRFKNSNDLFRKISYLINNLDVVEKVKKQLPKPFGFEAIAAKHKELYATILEK